MSPAALPSSGLIAADVADSGAAAASVAGASINDASGATAIDAQPPARVRMPLRTRGWALNVLGALGVVAALKLGSPFFIPLLCGILIAFVLDPIVDALQRRRVPRPLGASFVMVLLLFSMGWGAYALYRPAQDLVEDIPRLVRKVVLAVDSTEGGTLARMRAIISETQRAAQGLPAHAEQRIEPRPPARGMLRRAPATATSPTAPAATTDVPSAQTEAKAAANYSDWLLASSMSVLTFAGQFGMVLFLVFFLLIAGDTFKRKLVKIAGPTFTQKKITVKILDDIDTSIKRYMWVLAITNLAIGVLTGLMLWMMGFDSAAGLGLAAGLLHVIPYAGPAITAVILLLVGLIQFEALASGLVAAAGSLVIATIVGMLVTTWMTGRFTRMNATAVFVSLLFFGWLWGAWGLLLGLPLIVMIKTVADHVEQLEPLSELLSA